VGFHQPAPELGLAYWPQVNLPRGASPTIAAIFKHNLARFLLGIVLNKNFGSIWHGCGLIGKGTVPHTLIMLLFAYAAGLTLSGIAVNGFRLIGSAAAAENPFVYYPVMAVAGPSVLIESASRSLRTKQSGFAGCTVAAFCSFYWSTTIGLLLLCVCGAS